jgi:hypothetical protein
MELHQIKKFLPTKEMVSKLKKPSTEWEKIFTSYTSDKGLIIGGSKNYSQKIQ